jgi:hypothetical protein
MKAGRPDEYVKKIAQNVAQPVFCQDKSITVNFYKSSPQK